MYISDLIPESDRKTMEEKYRSRGAKPLQFGRKPALLIVDMTNGFVEDRYPTGYSLTGKPCAENIRVLLDHIRKTKIPVLFTKDVSGTDEVYEIFRGAWNFKTNMTPAGERADYNSIIPLLEPRNSEPVIEKSKPSAFFGTALVGILNYLGVDSLIVTGMVTSGCIRATVLDAFSYNFHVNLPIECVADRSRISHEVTLFDLDAKYANVMPLKQVIAELEKVES